LKNGFVASFVDRRSNSSPGPLPSDSGGSKVNWTSLLWPLPVPGVWTAITTAAIAAGTPAIPLKENRTGAGVEPLTMSGSAPLTIRGSDPFGLEKLLANGSNVLPELAGTRVTRASELSMVSRNSTR